jgi:hypothetical protein
MAKVLRTIAVVAGAVALVATGIGAFAAAGTALAATAGTVASIATVVGGVAGIAARVLTKPPPARGSVTETLIEVDPPSPYAMGEGYFAGVMRHRVGYGPTLKKVPNPFLFEAIALSVAGPIAGPITPQVDFGPVTSYYSGWLAIDTRLGARPDTALTAPLQANPTGWGSDHKLSGVAAIAWNHKFDKEGKIYASGLPTRGVLAKWVKVYDPRKDSTRPGGSGAHRLGNETTYEWSENPALHAGTYAFGRFVNGKRVVGVGIPEEGIDWEGVAAWASDCEANSWRMFGVVFEGAAGDPERRWQNLRDICIAGGAEPLFSGAVLGFHWQRPRISLDTVTEADLADGPQEVTAMQSWRDRLNTLRPRYTSPDHNWTLVPAKEVQVASYLAEDGEEKAEEIPFNFVKDVDQAAQLAAYWLTNSRELTPITLTLMPRLRTYRPGECLRLEIPELGLDHDAVILRRQFDPATMTVTMTLVTEDSAKHAFALGRTGEAPPTPSLTHTAEARDTITREARAPFWPEVDGPGRPADDATRNVAMGTYDAGTTYIRGDEVIFSGSTYRLIVDDSTGNAPPDALRWALVASAGSGTPGADGLEGLTILVSNEAHVVATDAAGSGGDYSAAGGQITLRRGATVLTPTFSIAAKTPTSSWISIDSSTGVYTVSDPGVNFATATLRATWAGVNYDRTYTLAKSRQGVPGENAKTITVISDRQTIAYDAAGSPSPSTQTTTFTTNKQNTTGTVNWTITDAAGVARTPVTSFLSSATGDSVTMTEAQFNSARNGTSGVIVTGSMTDGTTFNDRISVVRVQAGATGQNAITGFLNNQTHTVAAASNGTGYSLASAGGTFNVFNGITDVTLSGTTFSVVGSATKNGLTITINSSGVYSLSGASWTTDTESFTLRAVNGAVTIDRVYTIAKSKAGQDGLSATTGLLTNEAHTVPSAADGTGYLLTGAGGNFEVFFGSTNVRLSSTFSIVGGTDGGASWTQTKNGLTLTINETTGVYSLSGPSWTTDIETFTLRAVYLGVTIDQIYTISKAKAGAGGAAAKLVTLSASRQQIRFNSAAALDPSTQDIVFTATRQGTAVGVVWSIFDLSGASQTPLSSFISPTTGDSVTMTAAQFNTARGSTNGVRVRATVTDGSAFFDEITVVRVQDGAAGAPGVNAITGFLTNEASTLAADSAGVVSDFNPASGTFKVFNGITDVTTSATFSVQSETGCDANINASTGAYTVASMSSDTATAVLRAVFGGVTIDKTLSLSKSRAGGTGSSAPLLTLSASAQAFTFDGAGTASPATQNITFTAVRQNVSGTVVFAGTLFDASGASLGAATLTGTGDTRTLSLANFGAAAYAVVTATLGALTDQVTVVRLRDGVAGVSATLTNEAHSVQTDALGFNGDYSGAGGTMQVRSGADLVSPTFSIVSTTPANTGGSNLAPNPEALELWTSLNAGATSNVATLDPLGGTTADKIFEANTSTATWARRLTIVSRPAGTYIASIHFRAEERTFARIIYGTATSNRWFGATFDLSAGTVTQQNAGSSGTVLGAGITAVGNGWYRAWVWGTVGSGTETHLLYAQPVLSGTPSPEAATGMVSYAGVTNSGILAWGAMVQQSTTLAPYAPWITFNASTGVYTVRDPYALSATATLRATFNGVNYDRIYSLAKSPRGDVGATGAAGTPAITGFLTNESFSVFAYANGNVVSYAGATGSFRVFQGSTDVSANFTLSTQANPQSLTVSYVGQTYTVTGAGASAGQFGNAAVNTATLTIRATGSGAFAGITIDKDFTLAKTRGGYEIVDTLPVTDLFEGRIVFLTTDDKLYRYTGSAWTTAVPAVDISGQLADSQIAALAASKVTGQLSDAQIAAIAATKVTGQLTDAQIAALAATKITGQITTTQITDDAITAAKIAANAVTASEIAANAVVADKIAANAVTAGKINAGAVTATEIAAGAVVAGKIAAGAVTATEIAAGAVVAGKIAAGAVQAAEIAAGAVIAGKIAANAVTATEIATDAITANKIQAGAVTAAKISVTQLSAINANIGEVTAGTLRSSDNKARFELNNARIIFNDGAFMKVSGSGFGSASQFIEWFGPTPSGANVSLCTEANAISYLKTNGDAYFGGSLSAGVRKNAAQSTLTGADASVTLGEFTSIVGSRTVITSYNFSWSGEHTTHGTAGSSTSTAALTLERSVNGGSSWTTVATFSYTITRTWTASLGPTEPGTVTFSSSNSATTTDTTTVDGNMLYRLKLTSRPLNGTGPEPSSGPGTIAQTLGIISTQG